MNIGKPKRTIEIEPTVIPVPEPLPVEEPETVPAEPPDPATDPGRSPE